MRPRVVTVFAITGFCLSSELAAAAAQGGLWSGLSGGRKHSLRPPISKPSLGRWGVPFAQEGPWGGRGRAQACSRHRSGDVTCSLLPSQGRECEQAPNAGVAAPGSRRAVPLSDELQRTRPPGRAGISVRLSLQHLPANLPGPAPAAFSHTQRYQCLEAPARAQLLLPPEPLPPAWPSGAGDRRLACPASPGDRPHGAGDKPLASSRRRDGPHTEVGREALEQPPCSPRRTET